MKGHIISYADSLSRKDITLINYYLFGRIVNRKTQPRFIERYYYPGLFEATAYVRLANGCYFTERIVDDFRGRLRVYPADVNLPPELFQTARQHWKKFIEEKGYRVKNF
ncbi:MAG: hypothetical protein Q8O88_01420 [bacterium]|nr:hypothetical protein [bacterium]